MRVPRVLSRVRGKLEIGTRSLVPSRVSTLRRVVLGVAVVFCVAQTAVSNSPGRLRARQGDRARNSDNNGGSGGASVWRNFLPQQQQSLKSVLDPQCNGQETYPCTLNTTAIGMVERGYATYYDEDCPGIDEGVLDGCVTANITECRTCYLSMDIYMEAFNATEASMPNWPMCPCCVPTTLEDSHVDIEVQAFNYTKFDMPESECTDPPTPAPVENSASDTPTPADMPVAAPTTEPTTTAPTTAPPSGSRAAPSEDATPEPAPSPSTSDDVGAKDVETSDDGADGLSTGAKIGIGAGSAVGVIILGAAGFGIMKASGRA